MFLKRLCVLPLWLKERTPRNWKFPRDSPAGRGNSAAVGGGGGASREDAVSRTTPRQMTSQGADWDALGPLSIGLFSCVSCFLLKPYPQVRPLKVDLGDHAGSLCPSSQRGYIDKIPFFLLFAIILAPFVGLVRIYSWIWLVKGTEHMAPETSTRCARARWVCALKGQGVKSPWIWLELWQLWVTNTGAGDQTQILWKSNLCS